MSIYRYYRLCKVTAPNITNAFGSCNGSFMMLLDDLAKRRGKKAVQKYVSAS